MTYAAYLALFFLLPIGALSILSWQDWRSKRPYGAVFQGGWAPFVALGVMLLIAILYTFPWDNHLIAMRVWSYRPTLLIGKTLDWVPVEEVTFFCLQTVLLALWLFWLMRRIAEKEPRPSILPLNITSAIVICCIWLVGIVVLFVHLPHATYIGWEIAWALPPIMLQVGFAADRLWQHRQLLTWAMLPMIMYLSVTDALAIHLGIWIINPQQSLGILLGGVLPLEEFIFYSVTTMLVVFGLILSLDVPARERVQSMQNRLRSLIVYLRLMTRYG
jgi:lycopene beta-cyclase